MLNTASPLSPMRTVSPEKKTAFPAVATVVATASSTSRRGQFLPEATGHKEGVVDREAESKQGGKVQDEDRQVDHMRSQEYRAQNTGDADSTHDDRHTRGHQASEDQHEREQCKGDRDDLRPAQVVLGHGFNVGVERGAASHAYLERCGIERLAHTCDEPLSFLGGNVEVHQVVGGVTIARDLARILLVCRFPGHVRQRQHGFQRLLALRNELRGVGVKR